MSNIEIKQIQDHKKKIEFVERLVFEYQDFLKANNSRILLDLQQREFWIYDSTNHLWFKRVENKMADGVTMFDELYNFLLARGIFESKFTSPGKLMQEATKIGATLIRDGHTTPNYAEDRYHNLMNGIYDSRTHELVPHTSTIFTDYKYQFELDINKEFVLDEYPLLRKLFTGALGDDDKVIDEDLLFMVRQMFGTMISPVRYPVMYICIGEQGTAKSTFAELLYGFVGRDRCGSSPLENFAGNTKNKFGNHKAVVGNKLNVSEEIPEEKLNASNLKTLISEPRVETEAKGKGQRDTEFNTRLFGTSNNVLEFDSGVAGIDRRLKYIRFSREIPSHEIDLDLVKNIVASPHEMSGLFLFAIEGYKSINENKDKDNENWRAGFYQSDDSLLAKQEVEYKSRPVYNFLNDISLVPGDGGYQIDISGLLDIYKDWAENNGHEKSAGISLNSFSRQFGEYVSQKHRISKTVQVKNMRKRINNNTKTVYEGLVVNIDTLDELVIGSNNAIIRDVEDEDNITDVDF